MPRRKNKSGFGKRGLQEKAEPERNHTAMERLKTIGGRWLGKTALRKPGALQGSTSGKPRG